MYVLSMKCYISFTDTEIKLPGFTTNGEILENATMNTYDFNITKKILFYTPYHAKNFTFILGNMPFNGCPVANCFVTDNKFLLMPTSINQFDAIIFHPRDMTPEKIPKKRLPHQHYVMFMLESAIHDYLDYHKFQDFFNWTMTFRRDSDFYRYVLIFSAV